MKPTPLMIINEISKLMGDKIRSAGDQAVSQRSVRLLMRELAHHDGCIQLDLVKSTHLKAPTVSVTLQKMENSGLVLRKPDENDLRVIRVFMTEKGIAHNRAVMECIKEEENLIMQGISEQETEILLQLLFRMRKNIVGEEHPYEKG